MPVVDEWQGVTIELEMHSYEFRPVDWAALSDTDLLDALASPYLEQREAAMLALSSRP